MCVIVYKDKKIKLSKEVLKNITTTNPDGLGIAWKDGDEWVVEKYLHYTQKDLEKIAKRLKNKEAVIHARIATSGGVNLKNTHPFMGTKYTLFHNGIVSSLNGILEGYSDTNLLHALLEKCKYNQAIEMLTHLSKKEASKFILINNKTGELRTFGDFSNYEGLECSNLNFTYRYDWKGYMYDDFDDYGFTGKRTTTPITELPKEIEDRLWKEHGMSQYEIEGIIEELNYSSAEPTWSNVKAVIDMWYPKEVYNTAINSKN